MTAKFYTAAEIDDLLKPITAALTQLQSDVKALQQAPPPAPPPKDSKEGTKIAPGSGSITDQNGDVWTLGSDMMINKNGAGAYRGWQSHEMVYHAHAVYIAGLDGNWYEWNGTDFVRAPSAPPGA